MNNQIIKEIEESLQCTVTKQKTIGGGCIAQTSEITTDDNRSYFLKQGFKGPMFKKEANGLIEIKKAKAIEVPEVVLVSDNYLLLEHIMSGHRHTHFFQSFGEAFANLHRHTNTSFGFYEDNFIGSTPQINTLSDNWIDFYFAHRLLYQYKLAENNGYTDKEFQKAFALIEKGIHKILNGSEELPCLLHGDLWGGNYLANKRGDAVLIDPAVYYGHREADLAMTKLFGGFHTDFYNSYINSYPLQEGYEDRENIYLLYHVLNHLNLFGSSYKSHAVQLMNSYK
ncbi:fructosamine kinase family protein [Carboxylicivirga marina]|uniref:Fructosamine kinase family protein n=1 Tax=Carboxylicivirga marina TaxID=2800988 RepID=A0ABS1HMR0_9BACT|nr:fructosamine kinase family protein [Carboxylicivirga marina]MBK3518952.1 fructosamine kinase family protein [Carboxylicivirga marina]